MFSHDRVTGRDSEKVGDESLVRAGNRQIHRPEQRLAKEYFAPTKANPLSQSLG